MSRKRYWYNPQTQRVEDWATRDTQPEGARVELMTGSFYDGARTTDGTDIGSRKKREEYMRQNGLADASDYTQHLEKARKVRDAFYSGQTDEGPIRAAVAQAFHQLQRKR